MYYSGTQVQVTAHLVHRHIEDMMPHTYELDLESIQWEEYESKTPLFNTKRETLMTVRPGTVVVAGRLLLNMQEPKWFERRAKEILGNTIKIESEGVQYPDTNMKNVRIDLYISYNNRQGTEKSYQLHDIRFISMGTSIVPSAMPQTEEYRFIARQIT